MSIEKSLCICIKCKSVTACEPLCSCFSQCDKQCGGGTKNRKIFCYIGDKLAKLQCDVNSILYSIDTCNNNPCGDGVYVFFLLLGFSFFTSIIFFFFVSSLTASFYSQSFFTFLSDEVLGSDLEGEEEYCEEEEEKEEVK